MRPSSPLSLARYLAAHLVSPSEEGRKKDIWSWKKVPPSASVSSTSENSSFSLYISPLFLIFAPSLPLSCLKGRAGGDPTSLPFLPFPPPSPPSFLILPHSLFVFGERSQFRGRTTARKRSEKRRDLFTVSLLLDRLSGLSLSFFGRPLH